AEHGMRGKLVTGVRTCALPTCPGRRGRRVGADVQADDRRGGERVEDEDGGPGEGGGRPPRRPRRPGREVASAGQHVSGSARRGRSEERRVGNAWSGSGEYEPPR